METIRIEAGKQFDAEIVEVFLQIESQFREIRDQYADSDEVDGTSSNLDSDAAFSGNRNESEQSLTPKQEQALLQVLPPNEASERNEEAVEATLQ